MRTIRLSGLPKHTKTTGVGSLLAESKSALEISLPTGELKGYLAQRSLTPEQAESLKKYANQRAARLGADYPVTTGNVNLAIFNLAQPKWGIFTSGSKKLLHRGEIVASETKRGDWATFLKKNIDAMFERFSSMVAIDRGEGEL